MEEIFTRQAPEPIGPYSQAVKVGDFIFLSGQIAIDPGSGKLVIDNFAAECKQVLMNMQAVLEAANCTVKNLAKVTVYLKDLNKFVEFNGVYSEFVGQHKPARACVEVSCLPKNVNVEVDAIVFCG